MKNKKEFLIKKKIKTTSSSSATKINEIGF
jgi:hypothetical protein